MAKLLASLTLPPQGARAPWSACAPTWLLLLVLAISPGCRTFKPGPVPQQVATCRQLTQQGASAIDRGDWKRAESLLQRAVQTCGTDVDARRHYSETLRHRGDLRGALAQVQEARKTAAEDPNLAVRAGELHLGLGQIELAKTAVDEALTLDPKSASAWTLQGKIDATNGQHRQALADFQRALGYAPDDYDATILVAEAYRQLNEPERALLALQSLADQYARGDEPQQVLYLEGLALTRLGRYDDAARMLLQAAQREQPTAEILCRLAEAELLAGQINDARNNVQGALAIDPNHAGSRALAVRLATAGYETAMRR